MAQVQVRPDDLTALVEAALGQASAAVASQLERSADLLQRRAASLEAAAARLEDGLRPDHPEVAGLRRAATTTTALAAAVDQARIRREQLPAPAADTWLVFGRVLQADGEPAAGLPVRAFGHTDAGEPQVVLKAATTDEDGDFALPYREADLPDPRPDPFPKLFIRVEDGGKAVLAESPDPLAFELGRAEYVQLVLPEPRRRAGAAKRPARAAAKRPGGRRSGGRRATGPGGADGREGR
jgi:hypothetical protein